METNELKAALLEGIKINDQILREAPLYMQRWMIKMNILQIIFLFFFPWVCIAISGYQIIQLIFHFRWMRKCVRDSIRYLKLLEQHE